MMKPIDVWCAGDGCSSSTLVEPASGELVDPFAYVSFPNHARYWRRCADGVRWACCYRCELSAQRFDPEPRKDPDGNQA